MEAERYRGRSDASGPAGPRPDTGATGTGEWVDPDSVAGMLREIDDLASTLDELRSALSAPRPPVAAIPPAPEPARAEPPRVTRVPVLYLEERVANARRAAGELDREVSQLQQRWDTVDEGLRTLQQELGDATEELAFLRTLDSPAFDRPAPRDTRSTDREPSSERPESRATGIATPSPAEAPEGAPRYAGFTSARYNTAVARLRDRRKRLLVWTLGLGALIAAGLEVANLLSPSATSPLWLAFLPIIWLVPVPFFVLSFRGSQRTLRRNHLETGVRT